MIIRVAQSIGIRGFKRRIGRRSWRWCGMVRTPSLLSIRVVVIVVTSPSPSSTKGRTSLNGSIQLNTSFYFHEIPEPGERDYKVEDLAELSLAIFRVGIEGGFGRTFSNFVSHLIVLYFDTDSFLSLSPLSIQILWWSSRLT